jgi:hypothetical protein
MNTIDRRRMLRDILSGAAVITAAVATAGLALIPDEVEADPLATELSLAGTAAGFTDYAQVVVGGPRRRRRRWVCWWHRGRRVCGWRWR